MDVPMDGTWSVGGEKALGSQPGERHLAGNTFEKLRKMKAGSGLLGVARWRLSLPLTRRALGESWE